MPNNTTRYLRDNVGTIRDGVNADAKAAHEITRIARIFELRLFYTRSRRPAAGQPPGMYLAHGLSIHHDVPMRLRIE